MGCGKRDPSQHHKSSAIFAYPDNDMFSGLTFGAGFSGTTDICDGFAGAGGNLDSACGDTASVIATRSTFRRFGVVQEVDAASMAVWLKYKNYSADIDFAADGATGKEDLEDLHIFAFCAAGSSKTASNPGTSWIGLF